MNVYPRSTSSQSVISSTRLYSNYLPWCKVAIYFRTREAHLQEHKRLPTISLGSFLLKGLEKSLDRFIVNAFLDNRFTESNMLSEKQIIDIEAVFNFTLLPVICHALNQDGIDPNHIVTGRKSIDAGCLSGIDLLCHRSNRTVAYISLDKYYAECGIPGNPKSTLPISLDYLPLRGMGTWKSW